MASKTTRREVLRGGLIAAGAAASAPLLAQSTDSNPAEAIIEKELAKPLSDEAKKLLGPAIASIRGSGNARHRFKLPDISEPSTVYIPIGVEK